jgi:hypothetical protein
MHSLNSIATLKSTCRNRFQKLLDHGQPGNYRSKDGNERSRRGRKRSLRNGASPRFGLMTLIAEKREGAWQVVVAQNTDALLGTPSELQQIKTPIAIPGTQSKPWGPALPDLSELCV